MKSVATAVSTISGGAMVLLALAACGGGNKGQRDKDSIREGPFDLPAAHIFKIGADGKVHEIEAMGFLADFNAPSGWEN